MRASELPESQKWYVLRMSNGNEVLVTGEQRDAILRAEGNFIKLKDGSVINKAFIVQILFDLDTTRSRFQAQT